MPQKGRESAGRQKEREPRGRVHCMRIRVLRHCMPPRSRLCQRSGIDGWSGLSHRRAARAPPPAQPSTGRTRWTAGRVGASLAARPFGWTLVRAVSSLTARRPPGAVLAPFAIVGGGSSAGPRWRGPARRAGWPRLVRDGASDGRAAGARRRAARRREPVQSPKRGTPGWWRGPRW